MLLTLVHKEISVRRCKAQLQSIGLDSIPQRFMPSQHAGVEVGAIEGTSGLNMGIQRPQPFTNTLKAARAKTQHFKSRGGQGWRDGSCNTRT